MSLLLLFRPLAATTTAAVGPVFPSGMAVQVGLAGSYRDTLIDEAYVVGVWPLSEVGTSRAKDITGNNNHGTYVGSGFTRGVSVDIPDGALGCTFDGTSYVEVPDDGIAVGLGLSLAGGSIDLTVLLMTSTNDGTLRAIVQKQTTNSSGNGWQLALQGGAIVFYLKVAGSEIFNFSRGAVADGALHTIHAYFDPPTQEAFIEIDGVQSGVSVVTATTEPAYAAGNLRIGMFNDGIGGFIGTLAFVMCGREGNLTLGAELQATRTWSTLASQDIRSMMPLATRGGIAGNSILDGVAQTGTFSLLLNNAVSNSGGLQGYYTVGHADCRTGWALGIPIRWIISYSISDHYEFRGRVQSITPLANTHAAQYVSVTCTDWMDVAANTYLSAAEVQIDQPSDQVFKVVIDQAEGRAPAAVEIGAGSSAFPFALDSAQGESETVLTELARIAASERGFVYVKGDTRQGGTLVFEGRGERQIQTTLDASFDNTMVGLEVFYSLDNLVNIVRVPVTPRRVDAAVQVLYSLNLSQQSQPIVPDGSVTFEGGYVDPAQEAQRVGGTEMVPLVAGTDYGFFANNDGTGADLSANLEVDADLGGNSFRVEFRNTGSQEGFLYLSAESAFQIRGKGIYAYKPVTVESRNASSVRRRGPRSITIELPYESSTLVAQTVGDFVLGILGVERPVPSSVTIIGNNSAAMMTAALSLQPGSKLGLAEPMTALTTSGETVGYFINEKRLTFAQVAGGGLVTASFSLAPMVPAGAAIWDVSLWDVGVWGF